MLVIGLSIIDRLTEQRRSLLPVLTVIPLIFMRLSNARLLHIIYPANRLIRRLFKIAVSGTPRHDR